MTKIKFECWWTNTQSINKRIINQFVFDEDLLEFEFVDSYPDFTIVLGNTNWEKLETPKERTFYFSQEPLWSPNQPKEKIHNYCSKIFIADKQEYPNHDEYIETLVPMLYAGRGESDSREEWDWSKKLKHKDFTKSDSISMIVTKNGSQHHNQVSNSVTSIINYGLRTELAIKLSNNSEVDIYGTYWEKNDKNIKGEIWNKHVGLDKYKFSISCENSIQKNYVSEKFWDVILTDTIPIYLGCTNLNEYIPDNCYISLNDKTIDEMIQTINEISSNTDYYYEKYINNIRKLKQDFYISSVYNLWEKVKEEIKNV
jgi:hypothetical protein